MERFERYYITNNIKFIGVIVITIISITIGSIVFQNSDIKLDASADQSAQQLSPEVNPVAQVNQEQVQLTEVTETGEANEDTPTKTTNVPVSTKPAKQPTENTVSEPTTPNTTPATDTNNEVNTVNPTPTVLDFTKGGFGQEGAFIHVSATMNGTSSGICTYDFYQNGTLRMVDASRAVRVTSTVTESKTCNVYIPVSSFPVTDKYVFTIDFVSTDNLTTAHQSFSFVDVVK